jgi:hypothetical protein
VSALSFSNPIASLFGAPAPAAFKPGIFTLPDGTVFDAYAGTVTGPSAPKSSSCSTCASLPFELGPSPSSTALPFGLFPSAPAAAVTPPKKDTKDFVFGGATALAIAVAAYFLFLRK